MNQPFDAYRRYMAADIPDDAFDDKLNFQNNEERQALFEAMQLASYGTQPLQMTSAQRHAFASAAMRSPEAFAWYDYQRGHRGLGPMDQREFGEQLAKDCDLDELPEGCRPKDLATLQHIAGIHNDDINELAQLCFRAMYSQDETWKVNPLMQKYQDRLPEIRRWYLVHLNARGPPAMTLRETGLHTVDYVWTKEALTKHIHDLADAGQDIPEEFTRRLDELNNDTHTEGSCIFGWSRCVGNEVKTVTSSSKAKRSYSSHSGASRRSIEEKR